VPAGQKPSPEGGQELPRPPGIVRADNGKGLLVGRSGQLSELAAALREVAGGAGCSVLVEGEAGIGKTSLVEAALAATERLGLQVYQTTAEELERRSPFGAIVDCLAIARDAGDPRRAEIARLRFVLRDRDAKFTRGFDDVFHSEGAKALVTPVRAPNANAYAEVLTRCQRRSPSSNLVLPSGRPTCPAARESLPPGIRCCERSRSSLPDPA
jgi:AAA ATPase domain